MANRYCSEIPVILEVREAIWYFREHGKPTVDVMDVALGRVGRDNGPALFFGLLDEGLLTRWACRRFIAEVWCACDHPDLTIEPERWVLTFDWAGYTVGGRRSERPATPLVLYRGATRERRDGMSWTGDIETARWFANHWNDAKGLRGVVWTAIVEPFRLLALNLKDGRDEHEYIVYTHGLDIYEYVDRERAE